MGCLVVFERLEGVAIKHVFGLSTDGRARFFWDSFRDLDVVDCDHLLN